MTPLIKYDNFAYQEAVALIEHLHRQKCSFFSCSNLGNSPTPRGVSFRFDVHARDIFGAYGFLAALYRRNIPGTFYLLADYSSDERARFAEFRNLVRSIRSPMEIGLHDSPVDAYLISQKFGGVAIDYWRWLQSEKSLQWLTRLAVSPSDQKSFHREVMDAFSNRVLWTKKQFGEFNTMASHGGEINQMFRKRLPELGVTGEFISSLFAENWITDERLAQVGLDADVEQFRKKAPLLYQVTDGGGQIKRMMDNINMFVVGRNRAVQILIHPYTWAGPLGHSGGTRDGEISVLLGAPAGTAPMGGRKWYQRLLRTRLMTVPGERHELKRTEVPAASHAEPGGRVAMVFATASDVQADVRYADVAAASVRALVVEGGESTGSQGQLATSNLFDYLSSPDSARQEAAALLGKSVGRYGPLVVGAIETLVRPAAARSVSASPPAKLAMWMLDNLNANVEGKQPDLKRLDRKELSYFMFSSSQRSQVMKRIVDRFLGAQDIPCFVDHGAGIGMVPLCTHFACSNAIKHVVCSEVKHDYVIIGTNLWQSLGFESLLEYQECSATKFAYPAEVSIVLFAQMLYRIPPQQRHAVIASAWQALAPGGLLIINELMDRDQSTATNPLLTSRELLGYLPAARESCLFWGGSDPQSVVRLQNADAKMFKRSDNFIVLSK